MKQTHAQGGMDSGRLWLALGVGGFLLLVLCLTLLTSLPKPTMAANTVFWTEFFQPTASGTYHPVALGDLNHDGHLDVVAGGDASGIQAWAGDGTGSWPPLSEPVASGTYFDLALGDLNNDAHLDIVAVDGGSVQIWTGDGLGNWSAATAPTASGQPQSVALGDINRDGDLDIAVGGKDTGIELWTGNGAFTWTPGPTGLPASGSYYALAMGDADRDGRPELVGASDSGVHAWEQYGGSWTERSSGLPTTDTYQGVALGDLDNDGDLDIAATSGSNQGVLAWTLSVAGSVWSWTPASTGLSTTGDFCGVALGNVDNDGKLDIAAAGWGGGLRVWTGDGAGTWTDASTGLPGTGTYNGLALGDLDDDGLPDLAAGHATSGVYTWRDAGTPDLLGAWVPIVSPTTGGLYQDLDLGDFDHDGDLDVVAASAADGIRLWTGDGGNSWSDISALTDPDLPTTGNYRAVAMGGIQPIGWLDVVAASGDGHGVKAWFYRDGAWIEYSTGLSTTGIYLDVALGDLDGDGILDLVAGGQDLGIGAWTAEDIEGASPWWDPFSTDLPKTGSYPSVAVGDLDNDGCLDIVAGGEGTGLGAWSGDCAGTWKIRTSPTGSGAWPGLALGDVNDDGKLDIVAAGSGIWAWAGDGDFGWAALTPADSGGSYAGVSLGDYNHDGKLDIAAGTADNTGLRVWAGHGGGVWTPYSAGLATDGDYPAVALGEIDHDGVLDLLGARYGAGSVHAWTGAEGAPPSGWANFSPSGWISTTQEVDCSIQVQDTGSGLDVDSAQYRFFGKLETWSDWAAAGCTGTDGVTTSQTLSVPMVTFAQDSGPGPGYTGNWVQFRVADVLGNVGYSSQELVYIDTTPPDNPTSFPDSSHWPGGQCRPNNTIWVDWAGASDATSGVARYSYVFSTTYELPDTVAEPGGSQGTSDPLPDGRWYIYVRTQDYAGNWAPDAAFEGPYCIDTAPPTNPTGFVSIPEPNVWTNDNTIAITWSGAADAGAGVQGYSFDWSEYASGWPDEQRDTTGSSTTSSALPDGDNWFFHIRTVDWANNWSTTAANHGPYKIDTVEPMATINRPSHESDTTTFTVSWFGWDDASGVASFDLQSSANGITWQDWLMATGDYSDTYTAQLGETAYFRVRATDNAGNLGDWSSAFDITVGVDVTVRVVDESDSPLSGAVVYLNGVEQGVTAGDGRLVVHQVLLGDQLAAKYLILQVPAVKPHHEWPYGSNWRHRVYLTNVDYNALGYPQVHTVSNTSSTQELVVRRDNPLIGFHILVSVEWDADRAFLDEVVDAFHGGIDPASEYLIDLTDGQMIYEAVEVVDNKLYWGDADYQIHASNQVWPNSTAALIYQVTGRGIHLPRNPDAFDPGSGGWDMVIGQRCLVHEFGHYAFDLDDEYKDANGVEDGGCTTDQDTTSPGERACFMDSANLNNEICSALPDHPHNTDTWQHAVHGESCWNTIWRRYRSSEEEWILERPSDRGSVMGGPGSVPVPDWGYSRVIDTDTDACPPFSTSWTYPGGTPVAGAEVWVEWTPHILIRQGQTLEDGSIEILGAHDGEVVRLCAGCNPSLGCCYWRDELVVSCPDRTAQAVSRRVVQPAPFGLQLGALPHDGGGLLEIHAQASAELASPPTVTLWQAGATAPVTVPLAYDSATETYTGTATLSADLGQSGVLRGQATDTQGHTVTVLAPFDVLSVPSDEYAELSSEDGNLELYLKPHSLAQDPTVSILPNPEVSAIQDGLVLVGKAYEIVVSTGQYTLDLPAGLSIHYRPEMLTDVISDTLAIFRWDAQARQWLHVGGVIGPEHSVVSTQVDRLSTFALLAEKVRSRVYLPLVLKDSPG